MLYFLLLYGYTNQIPHSHNYVDKIFQVYSIIHEFVL